MSSRRDFQIWVDADAAPRAVKEIIFRAAKRLEIETILVANQRLTLPLNNPFVRAVRVTHGADVADQHIVEHAAEGDLVVTADIPLASLLVEKGVEVLDPRGERYTPENIGERLSIRDFMEGLRDSGVETGGPSAYGDRDKREFASALDRFLTARRGS
ncbi:MAG: YaiI/YqxD family protein [Gemmatimonadales bacterium]|nr:MAG: YaiI/YqxD family protein [Gemmatimonadales bacterium]